MRAPGPGTVVSGVGVDPPRMTYSAPVSNTAGLESIRPSDVVASFHRLVSPGCVDETRTVRLGGVPQVVSIRGTQRDHPVLLMVHGGPAAPLSGSSWMWQRPLEDFFTVVNYDQRGAGRSYALTDPELVRPTMHPDAFVDDLIDLLEWVTDHLGVSKVALLGHSWGSAVAARAVLARPDLVSVYVGVGQVVSMTEAERASWRWARHQAERHSDESAATELDGLQPYPGEPETFASRLSIERKWVQRFGGFAAYRDNADYYVNGYVLALEHTVADLESADAGNTFSAHELSPRLLELDLTDVTSFPVPMVQILGRFDYMTPAELVCSWLESLERSDVVVEWFEHSAHLPMYEEPGRFLVTLVNHVLPLAQANLTCVDEGSLDSRSHRKNPVRRK